METETKYFMVHNLNNRQPYKRHFDQFEAEKEAKRLAKLHIGERFFVLESVNCFAIIQPEPIQIKLINSEV